MSQNRSLKSIVALAIAASISQVGSAQIALYSWFNLSVMADANRLDGSQISDVYTAEQFGTLNPYSHWLHVNDSSLDPAHPGTLSVGVSAGAAWLSAAEGEVRWRDMGWEPHTTTQAIARINDDRPVWHYQFMATKNGTFTMDYGVSGQGRTLGLMGVFIAWSGGPGGSLDLRNDLSPNTSGTMQRRLTAGETYSISLYNDGVVLAGEEVWDQWGKMDADFIWHITPDPIPEPSSLVALGFGAVALLRRRNK